MSQWKGSHGIVSESVHLLSALFGLFSASFLVARGFPSFLKNLAFIRMMVLFYHAFVGFCSEKEFHVGLFIILIELKV